MIRDSSIYRRAIINLLLLLLITIPFISCATTKTFWIPIYQISSGEIQVPTMINPDTRTIVNAVEGACLAYFKGEEASSVIYSNRQTFSLSNKIVLKNDQIVESLSTGEIFSNLTIWKSFYYDPALTSSEEMQGLFILKDDSLAALDYEKLRNGQLVEYIIFGQNSGTDALQEIILLDVLPGGFLVDSSEYWFRSNEGGMFDHKLINEANKNAIIFKSRLTEPMAVGDSFQIKIRIKLDLKNLQKDFY